MWFLTVFGLMWSSPAIIALSLPFAISFSTWISRSESSARIVAAASGAAVVARTCWSTLPAMCGEISDSPTAAASMPLHQLLDRRVLQQIAAGAGQDRVHHVLLLVGDREHDHAGQRRVAADVPGRLHAGHAGHVQVHHDDVGRRSRARPQRLGAVRRLADDVHALLLEQVAQAGPEEVVVVDEQDAQLVLVGPSVGRGRRSALPPRLWQERSLDRGRSSADGDRDGAPAPRVRLRDGREPQVDHVALDRAAGVGGDRLAVAGDVIRVPSGITAGSTATTPGAVGKPGGGRARAARSRSR